ncbi:hypothetical protein, conserved [Eimeria maxima]|uniref:Uncharacterized protein n=1 Tax=Eimeria maxima TaxID=5804 RepID=U6LYI3_EIMMA|nr:hypothetical protein, conserved [Eimeria maxima]CDJ56801.1 hypothetical protein, conserved [Eimeria maxima]
MATGYFRLALVACVCLLPKAAWGIAVAQERVSETLPWAHHGDRFQLEVNEFDNITKVPAAPHASGLRSSVRILERVAVVVAATTSLFLVFKCSSLQRRNAIAHHTSGDGLAVPQGNVEPSELYTGGLAATAVELCSASGEKDEIDVVGMQISILTLNPDDASTLSSAERRMVATALESLEVIGHELEVLHAKAADLGRQLEDVHNKIKQVTKSHGALEDSWQGMLEPLRAAAERLEEQTNSAREAYEERDKQRDQMGYSAAQEQRYALLLSENAERSRSDGTPPLTPRAAAAVAAAERVLQVMRRHSPLPVFGRPPLSQQAEMAENMAKVHLRALSQALQHWNSDNTALIAAAEEALREAKAVLGQLEAGGMSEPSKSLRTATDYLQLAIETARKSGPSRLHFGTVREKTSAAAARAVAWVKAQTMSALRISRDLGKMLRSMDHTEAQYKKIEALLADGITIFTVALHTEVSQEVPYEVYEPFKLALHMCERVLKDAANLLQPRWLAAIDKQKKLLLHAADAVRETRLQSTASGTSGIDELLESDMRHCRAALNQAKALYQSMMGFAAFRPALPVLTNACAGLKLTMDSAQTQLVQAADKLASAWETELKKAMKAFRAQSDDDARQLSSRVDEGEYALARIYYLADPSPQFEELEESLKRARLLVTESKKHQQQPRQSEQQRVDIMSTGAISRLRQWLMQKISGQE